ncbi:Gfo/Idh/MocA family protein [Maritalea porphyrae]|uniref:Oxidoreductase n=1 Tax=Maritalea porphyrae TaxID=880732 RepID=A0ABQ5UQT4_9HYPH|nr:Gfo/Idh/MocA family oxidoreductase [Maritalea porphyrae]GLQ17599.1 oxidoreductase [Maritalea porphyrae]
MTEKLGVGIIGAGNISAAYLRLSPNFVGIEVRAVADINMDAATARAEEFGVRAETVDGLLASDDISIIINLTIPAAHFEISKRILEAGKHVYSEKPYVLTLEEGSELAKIAAANNLRIGSAPDTFMGGSHQHVRHMIDEGLVGTITSGTAFVMGHGMEHWHPNPDFFYQPGAGPVLDIGPYYVTNLVQLLGPVKRVGALTATPHSERLITSEPRNGEKIPVDTPTTIHSLLEFQSGAVVTMVTSWDVWQHGHSNMELYGTEGTVHVPDPNFFGGDIRITKRSDAAELPSDWDHPFAVVNDGENANYRCAGLSDMAVAIAEDRPHRCSQELALHVVEVMTSVLISGEKGQFVEMTTSCERPAPLGPEAAKALQA